MAVFVLVREIEEPDISDILVKALDDSFAQESQTKIMHEREGRMGKLQLLIEADHMIRHFHHEGDFPFIDFSKAGLRELLSRAINIGSQNFAPRNAHCINLD